MEAHSTFERAFIQAVNLWRQTETVKEFVSGKNVVRMANELLGASEIRLYHDKALYKELEGGYTPWHADQYYWPLSSKQTYSVRIPLQKTPFEMEPVSFSRGSHDDACGRNSLPASTWYYRRRRRDPAERDRALKEDVLAVIKDHSEYGYRRILPDLEARTRRRVNHKRLRRVLRTYQLGLRRALPLNGRSTVDEVLRRFRGHLDLLKVRAEPRPIEVLSTDFTELVYAGGKAYFMAYLDIGGKLALGCRRQTREPGTRSRGVGKGEGGALGPGPLDRRHHHPFRSGPGVQKPRLSQAASLRGRGAHLLLGKGLQGQSLDRIVLGADEDRDRIANRRSRDA